MSLSGSIGGAIGDAIQGATAGLAMRRANDALDERDIWKAHAANLERQLQAAHADRQALREQLDASAIQVSNLQKQGEVDDQWIKKLRQRLAQCQKSLKHSSATSAGLIRITQFLMYTIKQSGVHELNEHDRQRLQEEFERAWDEFLTSGRIAAEPKAAQVVAASGARIPEDVTATALIPKSEVPPAPRIFV